MTIEEKRMKTLTTIEIDQAAYAEERKEFLKDYFSFRKGQFKSGLDALNHLTSMFYCLPATRYFAQEPEASEAFLKMLNDFDEELERYPSVHGDTTGVFRSPELIKKMDALLREFYKIMNLCGYSR